MELIKRGSDGRKEAVTMLFQRAFREEDVPDDWRSGVVVPIPKAGDTKQIENYRGITLLSTIGKTFVAILNRRLTGWLETRGILVKEQAGFREGYSTVDHPGRSHNQTEKKEEEVDMCVP